MPKTTPDLNKIRYATDPGKITEPEEGKKDEGGGGRVSSPRYEASQDQR